MKKPLALLLAVGLLALPLSAEDKKESDRLRNCGTVIKEIMDIPDDIPQDLIDKAECIIVYPSVLKAAFGIGGPAWSAATRSGTSSGPAKTIGIILKRGSSRMMRHTVTASPSGR